MIIIYLSLWNLSDIQNDPLEVDPVNPLCDLTRVRLEPNSDAKLRTPCTQSLVSGWVYIFLYEAWYSPQDWSWCIHTLYLKRHLNYPDSVWAYQIHQVSWRDLIWPRLTYDLPDDLSHRITWTQRRLLCFQSWSITSDPGLGPLVFIQSRVDTQPPPPLRCRVTFNLSSEKTSLPPLNALNYPAGLPAGLVFPTMPFLSMGQFWRRDYSPCIRKITAIHPPTPMCGFKSGRIMLPIRYSAAENSVIQPWNNTDTTWSHTWRFLYSTGGKMISTLFLS